ncbi:hypothetical protein VZT92_006655 [Zoarces viviparus]|uniref:Uncharacterized protein n=1 Tax=Zoarces viviparus TaxID=48416 RepID=A0AAW1FQ23_ZOAVI
MAGWEVMTGIGVPVIVVIISGAALNLLQACRPAWLPLRLQNWDFLPIWMTSLQPLDDLITRVTLRCRHAKHHTRDFKSSWRCKGNDGPVTPLEGITVKINVRGKREQSGEGQETEESWRKQGSCSAAEGSIGKNTNFQGTQLSSTQL